LAEKQVLQALVTGGAGFIGSHLVELLLQRGHQVLVWDNFSTGRPQNLSHLQSNEHLVIEEIDVPSNQPPEVPPDIDWVFHLAALADIVRSIQEPEKYFRANVLGTFNVLQALRERPIKKLVYAASSSCYGIPDTYPTPETAPNHPQYPYALTKQLAEDLLLHWGQVYGLPVISLRLFNVYGPRSRTSGTYGAVFGVFLAQKLANQPFTVVGDGTQTRDFTYVTDVAEAFLAAAESSVKQEVINVGSGNPRSVNDIVKLLSGSVTYIPKRPGEPDCTMAEVTKAKTLLKWQAKTSLEDGVAQLLREIDYWRDAPVWTPDSISQATKDWFKYLS
jgi:UDP-glucose 4-epimerase